MLGTYALSSGYYDAYYNKALKVRRLIRNDFDTAFESCDVILAPTTPTPAFKLGENSGSPMEMYLQDVYTISANLAGIPGLAIPAGTGTSGLPVGIQLLGPVLSEPTLFGAGKMIEQLS
jgi:aspartyl-tRNA(Asn)/glutamyl-tRNA(Gln) amidotransferase subunit A